MLDRRNFLLASGLAGATALTVGATAPAAAAPAEPDGVGRFDQPLEGFAPASTQLQHGNAAALGMDKAEITEALRQVADYAQPASGVPRYPGAVSLLAHHGVVVAKEATGWTLRYADHEGTELPMNRRIRTSTDAIYDMASISKLFTTLTALSMLEDGLFELDTPVAQYVRGYESNGKQDITARMLLTHTAGLPPDPKPSLWEGYPDIPSRKRAILNSPVQNKPGTAYVYSDLSMLSMQLLIEALTGARMDKAVRERVIDPLGLADTGYNPDAPKRRIAPTEYQVGPGSSKRGLVWGEVHDENAWSLGGVAGHAGIFSTAHDMAYFGQAILNGGSYGGTRILSGETTELIFTNFNERFPGQDHGLGFELNQVYFSGGLASPQTAGHTGFTGTSLVLDRKSRSMAILLTNRVHPNRDTGSTNPARVALANGLARAMRVRPVAGKEYWYTSGSDAATATLTSRRFETGRRAATLRFAAFVETESTDVLTVEFSTDGRKWTRRDVQATGTGAPDGTAPGLSGHGQRAWWRVTANFPEAGKAPAMQVRLRYTTDKSYTCRGICVDDLTVVTGRETVLDAEHHPSALTGDGWRRTHAPGPSGS